MEKPKHHIFVCCSFRVGGDPKGKCIKQDSSELIGYLESELPDRGLSDVLVTSAGCMKMCDHSPVMVVYPEGWWYAGVESEDAVDEILDALEDGRPASKYLLT
jgi:(2Fe-2S) ferredoxin